MNTKVKTSEGKELVYTYNGSALAIERTIATILENYYDAETNKVSIPESLSKYLGKNSI